MNRLALVVAVGCVGSLLPTSTARAGDEGWAAFGGFVGGVLVNEVSHHLHHRSHSRSAYGRPAVVHPAPVVVQPAPVVVHAAPPPPSGHWETRAQQYWVPGQWVTQHTPCGYQTVWQPGYYATRHTRVWVEHGGCAPRPRARGRYR